MDEFAYRENGLDGCVADKNQRFAFTLMLAKLWPQVLSLDWQIYGAVFVLAAIRPVYRVFK